MTHSKPRVLAVLPDIIPSTLMCVIRPFLGLQAAGVLHFRSVLERYFLASQISALRDVDLVVFCRNVEERYGYILDAVLAYDIPYIYDIDDNFFAVPPDVDRKLAHTGNSGDLYYGAPERIKQLGRYLRFASLVRVYSKAMYEQVTAYNASLEQVEAMIDWALIRTPPRKNQAGPVKIVYATSRRDDHLFPVFTPALSRLLDEAWPVEVHFLGFQPALDRGSALGAASGFQARPNVHYRKFDSDYDRFMIRFSSAGYDIGLAPMLDDQFHRAKTNTKFREYGACGIAGIYSNVPLYADWVEDGKTGLLVENTPDDWYRALTRLTQDADLRRRLGQAACTQVRQRYPRQGFQEVWQRQVSEILSKASPSTPGAAARRMEPVPPVSRASQPGPQARPPTQGDRPGIRQGLSRLGKLQQGLRLLFTRPALFFAYLQTHVHNLWWMFRINVLKHL